MLFAVGACYSQRVLEFDEALDIMLENNPSMKGGRLSVEHAQEMMRATKGLRWPQLNLTAAYLYMQRDVEIDLSGPKSILSQSVTSVIENGVATGIITPDVAAIIGNMVEPLSAMKLSYELQNRSVGFVGLQMQMPIYMGGKINVANRVSKMKVSIEEYRLTAIESALITQLVERYYGAIVARDVVAVRRDAVVSTQQHLEDAMAMFDEGVLTQSAVVYLKYQLSDAQKELDDAEHQLELILSSLQTLLNVDYAIRPIEKIIVDVNLKSIDYYISMSQKLNPILCEAQVGASMAGEGVKLARAELLPEVVAMGGGMLYDYQLSDMVPRWAVGVGVNLKLFDGLGKERRLKAAKIEEQRIRSITEIASNNISLLVEKEYYNVKNALKDISTSERLIDFATSYYESLLDGYREGVVSTSELMDAHVALAASKVEHLNALYDYKLSMARLLEASGMSADIAGYMLYNEM